MIGTIGGGGGELLAVGAVAGDLLLLLLHVVAVLGGEIPVGQRRRRGSVLAVSVRAVSGGDGGRGGGRR